MSLDTDFTPRQARTNARFAYAGCIVAQTGVQLVAPSLSIMRDALSLSDTQLALVMVAYLFPAAVGAIPAGILADRIGRRKVFGWSMIGFGVTGIALQTVTEDFRIFLLVRFLQGLFFAGLLPLTMTILGDAYRGSALIKAQGRRSVAMLTGDGTLPIVGGFLAAVTWQAPWLGQVLAIPFGLAVLGRMTDPSSIHSGARRPTVLKGFVLVLGMKGVIPLQYAGFLRMFLKFSILTFLPVLLIDERDLSPAFAGVAVGVSSLIGILPSLTAARIARLGRPTTFIAIGLFGEALALGLWAMGGSPIAIMAGALIFGIADGMSGVLVNSLVAAAPETKYRASFIALTGAVRNSAKFLGPVAVGLLILVMDLPVVFAALGALTVVSAVLVIPLRALDDRLEEPENDDTVDVITEAPANELNADGVPGSVS